MDPAVIRRGVPFALALKTEGRGRGIFFFPSPLEQVPLHGEATLELGSSTAITHWYVA